MSILVLNLFFVSYVYFNLNLLFMERVRMYATNHISRISCMHSYRDQGMSYFLYVVFLACILISRILPLNSLYRIIIVVYIYTTLLKV